MIALQEFFTWRQMSHGFWHEVFQIIACHPSSKIADFRRQFRLATYAKLENFLGQSKPQIIQKIF